eukprot:m.6397 g.6397  ORF g.6397 m.6397 type:complete len:548 (+) comp5152_c0_seq1:109-1752(+)
MADQFSTSKRRVDCGLDALLSSGQEEVAFVPKSALGGPRGKRDGGRGGSRKDERPRQSGRTEGGEKNGCLETQSQPQRQPKTEQKQKQKQKQRPPQQVKSEEVATEARSQQRPSARTKGRKAKAQNTESFDPSYEAADVRILVGTSKQQYGKRYGARDVVMVPELFCDEGDLSLYENLLAELGATGVDSLFVLWHGDSHLIADDKKQRGEWKKASPTFQKIIKQMETYFDMDIKATRFNWYRDAAEWKPWHHDRAAFTPNCPQNITVAASFGAERDISFLHAEQGTTMSMPQPNGCLYAFGRDVNIEWKHGVMQEPPSRQHNQGRISVIAWGWVDMADDSRDDHAQAAVAKYGLVGEKTEAVAESQPAAALSLIKAGGQSPEKKGGKPSESGKGKGKGKKKENAKASQEEEAVNAEIKADVDADAEEASAAADGRQEAGEDEEDEAGAPSKSKKDKQKKKKQKAKEAKDQAEAAPVRRRRLGGAGTGSAKHIVLSSSNNDDAAEVVEKESSAKREEGVTDGVGEGKDASAVEDAVVPEADAETDVTD